jgi:hypothetical protein
MSTAADKPRPAAPTELQEERYSLAEMLREVAEERQGGAFGGEKVHPRDIRKLFRAKSRKSSGNRR